MTISVYFHTRTFFFLLVGGYVGYHLTSGLNGLQRIYRAILFPTKHEYIILSENHREYNVLLVSVILPCLSGFLRVG